MQKTYYLLLPFVSLLVTSGCKSNTESHKNVSSMTPITLILGTTRQGRMSDKIAHALLKLVDTRQDVSIEIIDLRDYQLPFLDESTAPSRRTIINDPLIQRWSDKISHAKAFIFLVAEYNASYPAVFKNALDLLYKEWNGKPVGFVCYSGRPSGGSFVLSHLQDVVNELKMIPISTFIKIPTAWKALDADGNLLDTGIASSFNRMIDELQILIRTQ